MAERNSYSDESLVRGYSIHLQRYQFASELCDQKDVLDTGCGIGYGSAFLAYKGAKTVTAVDLSSSAIAEAKSLYRDTPVRYLVGDLQQLDEVMDAAVTKFDCIVNLENIEHLSRPEAFLRHAVSLLREDGVFICSTPNGELTERDEQGRIKNQFHLREYTAGEFTDLLKSYFASIDLHGQWQTHAGKARVMAARMVFEQLCEAYYNPMSRLGRVFKRMFGRPVAPPPQYTAEGESYPWDDVIAPLGCQLIPWPPRYLLAVCRLPRHG